MGAGLSLVLTPYENKRSFNTAPPPYQTGEGGKRKTIARTRGNRFRITISIPR